MELVAGDFDDEDDEEEESDEDFDESDDDFELSLDELDESLKPDFSLEPEVSELDDELEFDELPLELLDASRLSLR